MRDDAHTTVPFPTTLVADLAIVVIIVVVAVVIICVVRRQRGLHTFSKLNYPIFVMLPTFHCQQQAARGTVLSGIQSVYLSVPAVLFVRQLNTYRMTMQRNPL